MPHEIFGIYRYTGEGALLYQTLSALNGAGALINSGPEVNTNAPKAYINYILFNEKYVAYDFGFTQVSQSALETGGGVPHQFMQLQAVATEPGYVYIYLSNEHDKVVDVFFDDLKITHRHGPVVQSDSYYPFGLAFNSYSRENSVENKFLYNQGAGEIKFNTERQFDLGLNVDQSKYRTYDYLTGRWWQVDPKADVAGQESWSTYQFGFNNPVLYNDPEGDVVPLVIGAYYLAVAAVAVVGSAVIYYQGKKTIESTVDYVRNSNSSAATSKPSQVNSNERVKEKSLEDLKPLHSPELTEKTKSGQEIGKLSNEQLLDAVNNPENGDLVKENTETGKLVNGNTRVNELKKRAADPNNKEVTPKTKVKVQDHTPEKID